MLARSTAVLTAIATAVTLGALGAPSIGSASTTAKAPAVAKTHPPSFHHLDPGAQPRLRERVPVNIVLVGYPGNSVKKHVLRKGLADTYQPVIGSRLWYDVIETLGIKYRYKYNLVDASRRYENRLFGHLKRIATPAPLTAAQTDYNAQENNALDVTDNSFIDAPSMERWLAYHAPAKVDTRRNTVYLINGYGRSDFRFHVYTKTDEPDPDTGYNFGVERESRKIVAWGGTTADDEESGLGSTRRVWFYDLSAGPELWAGNSDVDNADIDGDGADDYRIPVAWEYGSYRPRAALSSDLALLVRYVALNMLMTSSPIYPVYLPTPDGRPRTINLDSNTYEGWAGVDASDSYITPTLLKREMSELLPEKKFSYDNQDLPFTGKAKECFDGLLSGDSCYPATGLPSDANLFLQNNADLARTKDDGDTVDYELPMFNYAVEDGSALPLGFADDNWADGTQTFVFSFISPDIVDLGYGLTTTQIHEVGHHLGLAHPHDGWDSETQTDYSPVGDFYFANAGDENNTIMSYIDLNWDFSQFDRDNMNRFQAEVGIGGANDLAQAALAAAHPARAYAELRKADRWVGAAEKAFGNHEYARARAFAGIAYGLARAGAVDAGVDVDRLEATARRAATDARTAIAAHDEADLVEPYTIGPRGLP